MMEEKREQMDNHTVVGIDLDETICEYDGWQGSDHFGSVEPGAKEKIRRLKELGFVVIIYTCRGDVEKVRQFLEEEQIPYDYINKNPYQPDGVHERKLWLDYYIGDEVIWYDGNWNSVFNELLRRERMKKHLEQLKERLKRIKKGDTCGGE